MKTALAENPFVQNSGERGDYRGARGNGSIGNGPIDKGPIGKGPIEQLDKGPIDPLNYSQSNSGGSLEPLAIEPKDKETWKQLKRIIAKCKKNFKQNKEKWEEMAPDPSQRFPTEEKLSNGTTWLINPQTGEKWGL